MKKLFINMTIKKMKKLSINMTKGNTPEQIVLSAHHQ